MKYTEELRQQYTLEQHAQIIDLSFGFLQKENVTQEIRVLFEESGIEPYLLGKQALWSEIMWWWNDANMLNKQFSLLCIEIQKLLQHFLYHKKPLSYKHIAYDEFKIGVNHKFVIFMDYTGAVGEEHVVLLTWTGDTQHRDHLTAFLNQHAWTTSFNSSLVGLDHLWWWWVRKTDEWIEPYSTSQWLWSTSQATKEIIFKTLFSQDTVQVKM